MVKSSGTRTVPFIVWIDVFDLLQIKMQPSGLLSKHEMVLKAFLKIALWHYHWHVVAVSLPGRHRTQAGLVQ